MGNFELAIPKTLKELETKLGAARRAVWSFEARFQHDCDCEYCDYDPDPMDAEDEEELAELQAEVNEILVIINRLKRHASLNGIELPSRDTIRAIN